MTQADRTIHESGFTLIEILITLLISSVVVGSIITIYQSQQTTTTEQQQIVKAQQAIRASRDIMTSEIRAAGFDPARSFTTGITTISNNSSITFIGTVNDGVGTAAIETISFSLDNINNTLDRAINAGGNQTLSDNIEALGFAYAFDSDDDGDLDTYNAGGIEQVIWAVDSDGDNDLDTNLDTDSNGLINELDCPAAAAGNGNITGIALADFNAIAIADVPATDIRAVRIWLLASTNRGRDRYLNNFTYTVGRQVISPATDADLNNDDRPMRLSDTVVKCKNMGLN